MPNAFNALMLKPWNDRVIIRVTAKQDPDLELWSARARTDLFERVFERQAIIHAENAPTATEPLA